METITSGKFEYIAFFDIDRTIAGSVSGSELVRGAYKRGLMRTSDMTRAVILSAEYRLRLLKPEKIINKMTAWVKGLPEETINKLCLEVFNEIILPSFFSQVKAEMEFHRKNNAGLVILSSSITPICKFTAGHFEMDGILCSELEVKDGVLTGRSVRPLCFGKEKAVRLKEYCELNHIDPGKCWYYGDSVSDSVVLSLVGFPICINPDRQLAKLAKKNGWRTEKWE